MIGATFRQHRTRLRLTQKAMATRLGVHWVTVNRWENGAPIPEAVAQLMPLLKKPVGKRGR